MNKDKKFHTLVKKDGIDTAIKEYYPNLSLGQVKAVTRHAHELVEEGVLEV